MQSMYSKYYSRAESHFSKLSSKNRELVMSYLNHLMQRQVSPYTFRAILSELNRFCNYLSEQGFESFSELTSSRIRSYLERLSQKNLSAGTIDNYLTILKRFFDYLVDEDQLSKNPVLRRYFLTKPVRLPRPMSQEDLDVFLENLQDLQYRAIFLLMVRSGLRIGEVSQLRVNDIHWEQQNLLVRNGKGKVDRVVYFSGEVEQTLRQWMATRSYESPYGFASSTQPEVPIPHITIRKWMESFLQKNGLSGKGYTPHTLRHTFATTLLNAGVPLVVLRDLMGHKSLDQTLMYAKLSDQTIRDSYDRACEQLQREQPLFKRVANA